jgi:hypothetical protein
MYIFQQPILIIFSTENEKLHMLGHAKSDFFF